MAVSLLGVSHRKQRHDIYWYRNQHVPVQKEITNVLFRKRTYGANKTWLKYFLLKYVYL